MTTTQTAVAHRRRVFVPPPPVESLPPASAQAQDPPIYRELVRAWADRGRTLPGRHDPEWARLVAPPAGLGLFSGSRAPRRDGR
ncbi:hypothetical protein STXM2123_4866 [Streptomyces sp. F-3]|uniref:DUF2934 domain-containing protein n=1 Tax=Streptomyces thermogriseus TaxID=75292 RepID=A0ABN1T411_9ACTN|nr:hypothetical protein STXM2123_4866 [Streptomyces sp. F-3]